MSKEANVTINPDHPMHPKNVAARAAAAQASHQTTSTQSPSEQTQSALQDETTETQGKPQTQSQESTQDSDRVQAGPHAGQKVTPSPEPKSKIWSKDDLFSECLAFTNDFANAGNLTGRAMLAYIERAQAIMNEYKKAKESQGSKGRKK